MGKFGDFLGKASGAIGGVLGAVTGFADSRRQAKTAERNTKLTIRANKEAAELAYQRQQEMWHMQNAYNSPQAQMQRYQDAGLNPHLIYGQGSPGNASNMPQYQPPDYQYQYVAPKYAPAAQTILPTIMEVGSWLQSMRQGEANIQKTLTETERSEQVIDYLTFANPELLTALRNKNVLFPYQKDFAANRNWETLMRMRGIDLDARYNYGNDNIEKYTGLANPWSFAGIGVVPEFTSGKKGLELQKAKADLFVREMEGKLKEAQASWADFDITNPQGLMQLVLSGALGMAGAGLAIRNRSGKGGTSTTYHTIKGVDGETRYISRRNESRRKESSYKTVNDMYSGPWRNPRVNWIDNSRPDRRR